MKKSIASAMLASAMLIVSLSASAAIQYVSGRVTAVQGHGSPDCREVYVRETSTGSLYEFRIANPTTPGPDTVGAVALAAALSQADVTVAFDPALTGTCGSQPRIIYITLNAGG